VLTDRTAEERLLPRSRCSLIADREFRRSSIATFTDRGSRISLIANNPGVTGEGLCSSSCGSDACALPPILPDPGGSPGPEERSL
jgi:hypothetical protein